MAKKPLFFHEQTDTAVRKSRLTAKTSKHDKFCLISSFRLVGRTQDSKIVKGSKKTESCGAEMLL